MQDLVPDFALGSLQAELIVPVEASVLPPAALGHVDEGQLVGRRRVEAASALPVLLDDDVVAQSEGHQHVVDIATLGRRRSRQLAEELLVVEVDVGDSGRKRSLGRVVSVGLLPDDHVLETHVVSGQSAGFISEDVLDLPQLLVERAGLHPDFCGLGGKVGVSGDPGALDVLDHFEGDDEGDGDEVGEEQHPAAPLHEELLGHGDELAVLEHDCVDGEGGDEGAGEGQRHLRQEDADHYQPHLELEARLLLPCLVAVEHDLAVDAGVDHHCSHPPRDLQRAPPQHDVVVVQRQPCVRPREGVDEGVRPFIVELVSQLKQLLLLASRE
jgi:hypothetical protein